MPGEREKEKEQAEQKVRAGQKVSEEEEQQQVREGKDGQEDAFCVHTGSRMSRTH